MSVAERIVQPLSVCHDGLATMALQPLPVAHGLGPPQRCLVRPSQTTSLTYLPLETTREVPPTQMTPANPHGCASGAWYGEGLPAPLSPALAVMTLCGCES